ncbi:MAG TPA: hypothetical protein VGK73_31565 [Polyangiaceae bacterium]
MSPSETAYAAHRIATERESDPAYDLARQRVLDAVAAREDGWVPTTLEKRWSRRFRSTLHRSPQFYREPDWHVTTIFPITELRSSAVTVNAGPNQAWALIVAEAEVKRVVIALALVGYLCRLTMAATQREFMEVCGLMPTVEPSNLAMLVEPMERESAEE